MTDRELLELAARAAGIDKLKSTASGYWYIDEPTSIPWNPLRDPGDALRLAVELHLVVDMRHKAGWDVAVCVGTDFSEWVNEKVDEDPLAATMRAITRAAAEIGKGMVK